MENHEAGFPPFPLLLEIPAGFPHSQRFGGERYSYLRPARLAFTQEQSHFRRKGLVNSLPGTKRKSSPGALTSAKVWYPLGARHAHIAIRGVAGCPR
jgi:hypothetical protein